MAEKTDMLDACRDALRIPTDCAEYDDDISDLIDAARSAMRSGGISSEKSQDDADSSIRVAIKVYVKANFGLDNPYHDRLSLSFEDMITRMAHDGDYMGER